VLEDVEKKKKGMFMITANEFDEKFDNNENIDEFIDYENSISVEEFKKTLNNNKIELSLSEIFLDRLKEKSNLLKLSINDTIKVLLAKELGLI